MRRLTHRLVSRCKKFLISVVLLQEVVTKPIMITSSEQILQALAKYNFSYRMLSLEEKFSMLNELQQVEWKLGRAFDVLEVGSLDTYFSSDLEKLLAWLTDRMQLIASSVRQPQRSS